MSHERPFRGLTNYIKADNLKLLGVANMNSKLTDKEAFLAMYSFLDEYYQLTKSDDIGSLLGSMSLLENGKTADPAIESDWHKAVERAMKGEVNAGLVLRK